jgi:alpha-beta hydrolase superfamily lysophospholipase
MARDPLELRTATARFFVQGVNMDLYIEREIARNEVPILLFLAGQDQIIDNDGVLELLRRGVAQPEVRLYEDQVHSIQFDAPERLVADIERWLAERRR